MNDTNPASSASLVDSIARLVAGHNQEPTKGGFAHGAYPVAPYAIVPDGYKVERLDPAPVAPLPPHIIQTVTLNDTRSFCGYVNKFAEKDTALFLDKSGKFVAVFDWHSAPRPVKDATTEVVGALFPSPRRTAHRASFTLAHSEQWTFWAGLHDKWLTQQQIIEIFEGRRADISSPTDSELLRCASEIRSQEGVEMVARYERNSGQSVMVRKEAVVGTLNEETKVIGDLVLSIPCFENGNPVEISVLINWNGKLTQFVKVRLLELEAIKRKEAAVEFEIVQTQTGMPVLLGTPQ